MTYQSKVRALLEKLIHLHNLQSEEALILQLFNALTRECLAYPLTERLPPFSWICGDGTPIQFSVSLSRNRQERQVLRYVTEVCTPVMELPARVAMARKRVPMLLKLINAMHLQPRINRMLELLLPSPRLLPDHSMFGFWIGVQHHASSAAMLKIYCNLLWQLGDPWSMFHDALRLLDRRDVENAIVTVRKSLGSYCWPNSIGLECTANGFGRVKLYLRGYQLSWSDIDGFLRGLGWVNFEPALLRFHQVLLGGRKTYIPRSVVLSIGAPRKPGESYDVKVEVGPDYYVMDDENALKRIIKLAGELMLDVKPYEQMLDVLSDGALTPGVVRFHDVIGIGLNPQKGPCLNIYLRPDLIRYHKTTE